MKLFETARKFIENQKLFGVLDSVLVGVSGGMDSMCLVHILQQLNYKISVAHVNYHLRGDASDKDEQMVVDYCKRNHIRYHIHNITQEEAASLAKENLQEVARIIRYRYFEELQIQEGYKKIAIAHHQQDVAETFLMNAMRGSGSKGLRAIQSTNGNIVRPLLEIPQSEISNYVTFHNIPYRTDESNYSNKYTRNFIRNKIIPELTKQNHSAIDRISHSASLLSDENKLLQYLIEQEKATWINFKNEITKIGPISQLILLPGHATLLWSILSPFGLSKSDINDIIDSHTLTGSTFSTSSHDIIVNRDYIKIEKKSTTQVPSLQISTSGVYENELGILKLDRKQVLESSNTLVEIVDLEKVQFPLSLRLWKQGDKWKPLGMKGRNKKISDYLIDQKVDRLSKNRTLVLEDATGNIIWLVGYRISEIVKTTKDTTNYLHLTWLPKSRD